MRFLLATVVVGAAFAAGCSSTEPAAPSPASPALAGDVVGSVDMKIRGYQVVWTRGGRLGYVKSYDTSRPGEPVITLHTVEDLDFRQVGWISNDGQGERFVYPAPKFREMKREPFDREVLPAGDIEDQLRRIFGLDPTTEIALRPADPADLKK